MTGYPESNVPAFKAAKTAAEAAGYEGILPDDMDDQGPATDAIWSVYMPKDVKLVLESDGLVMLPEWGRSRGAKIEIACGLMQCLKYPKFMFFEYYQNSLYPTDKDAVAAAWYHNWDIYSKVAQIAA